MTEKVKTDLRSGVYTITLADPDNVMGLKKKERLMMDRDAQKLRANLSGLRDMKRLPDAMFVKPRVAKSKSK